MPITLTTRNFYGATYLFDRIGKDSGVTEDLKTCFPDSYRQILSIAYYLILEDKNPLSRFPRWAALHRHPYGDIISSQRSSELFASITEEARQSFFRFQGKRRVDKEYLAYDSTSVSSYSKCLRQVRYGKNKDHEHLAQIYRNKDLVEKAFENLKDRLNLRRVAVSSEQSLDGKLFVQFIALIFLSYVTKKMQENNLFKKHTMQEILDEFDII